MKFDTMLNGYNRYQVDDAIRNFEEEILLLKKQLEAYKLQSEEDQIKVKNLNECFNTMKRDLDIKEQAATEMSQIALKEASEMIQIANNNADLILKEALLSAKEMLISVSKLGIEAKGIKENLNEQLEMLTQAIDQFDVPPIPSAELLQKSDD